MAQRYYLYYKQTGTGNLTVGKPSGYTQFLHNPDAKRMSFLLPDDKGKGQEIIGKFIQDFQRLNAGKFSISNAVVQNSSTPMPPAPGPSPKPPTGKIEPKPPTVITGSGSVEPQEKEKKDDDTLLIIAGIIFAIFIFSKMNKGKRRR
ncbi:hypothetical protein B1J93_17855 [Leptospira kirschneri serovar Pomona]|uniref:Uncharacterized protein n=1 Tax=Leptospira kirschneri serovar Pomona TaxID=561005 RepID=A0A1T1DH64_9LEPT|nr:hypothetical protein [Leptospira kirschneri]OOV40211.1 hypothetical protein B1J93_17855 [Leptospira kirschneri serovar Pomona]